MTTLALLFVACALTGIAVPMPEDLVLIGAGALVSGLGDFAGFWLAAALGLLCRDGLFFTLGHFAGEGILQWPRVRRFLGEGRIERARRVVEARGGQAVLIARFLIGFRATGFLVSGALGVRYRDFLLWDGLGLSVSVPAWLALGYVASEPISAGVGWLLEHRVWVLASLAVVAVGWWLMRWWRRR